jgi:quinoprotein glucose dehydrogenase
VVAFNFPAFRRLETSRAAAGHNGTHGPIIAYYPNPGGGLCYSICPAAPVRPVPAEGYPADPLPYPAGLEGTPSHHYVSGFGFALGMGRPPYTTITAYDLNKGTIKWQIPYGEAVGVQPPGNNLGLLQFHSPKAPPLVTPTGLLFTATTDKKFRAYDKETGKVVWSADLPDSAMGALATYELGGKQYIVVSARGQYVAYTLP